MHFRNIKTLLNIKKLLSKYGVHKNLWGVDFILKNMQVM